MPNKEFFEKSEFDKDDGEFKIENFEETEEKSGLKSNKKGSKTSPPIKPKPGGFVSFQKEEPETKDEKLKNVVFIQDHSIISSVEDYALRVRIEAEEYAENKIKEADQYHETNQKLIEEKTNNFNDERLKIEKEIKELTEERDKIYEKIKKDAHKEGFREGKNEILEKSEENVLHIESIMEDLNGFYGKLLVKYEKDMMDTALLMASKIIRKEISKEDSRYFMETLKKIIKEHKDKGKIKLYIHPKDYELFEEKPGLFNDYLGTEGNLTIEIDENISMGSVQVETDIFYIDTNIGEQLEHMKGEIRKAYYERLMKLTKSADLTK